MAAGKIFVNYRRGDDAGNTGRLYDRLQAAFTPEQLFMDVEGGIGAGADFVDVLRDQVAACDVLLAVIGGNWLTVADGGRRRLDNPEDFVRIEIEAALSQGKHVIPVLVGGAAMPPADQLPNTLKPLSRRNAVRLTHERFHADCAGLIKSLEFELEKATTARQARAIEARLAAEAAEQQRVAQAQRARAAEAERQREKARLDVAANLTPDQITRAEELANWEFIKDSADPQEHRDHLARFPSGVTARIARAKLASVAWTQLGAQPTRENIAAYLDEFPDSPQQEAAWQRWHALVDQEKRDQFERDALEAGVALAARETAAWDAVKNTTDAATLAQFMAAWPGGVHAAEARRLHRAMTGTGSPRLATGLSAAYAVLAVPAAVSATYVFRSAVGMEMRGPITWIEAYLLFPLVALVAVAAITRRRHHITAVELANYWSGFVLLMSLVVLAMTAAALADDINRVLPVLGGCGAVVLVIPVMLTALINPGVEVSPWVIYWVATVVNAVLWVTALPGLEYLQPVLDLANATGLSLGTAGQLLLTAYLVGVGVVFTTAHLWFRRRALRATRSAAQFISTAH